MCKGIIQKGIKEVITTHPDLDRKHNNLDESLQMFNEAGVKLRFIENI
jgi:deoxycytidylate deaminase